MSKSPSANSKQKIANDLKQQADKVSSSLENRGKVYKTALDNLALLIKLYSEKKWTKEDASFWALQNIS